MEPVNCCICSKRFVWCSAMQTSESR